MSFLRNSRGYRVLGWAFVAAALGSLGTHRGRPAPARGAQPPVANPPAPAAALLPPPPVVGAEAWFRRAKPYCNSVEVATLDRELPPAPGGYDGVGYHAGCLALAGKIDDARRAIDALPVDQRSAAAEIVFTIGHPVADMGDDRSAGPIMELVIDYIPTHYMALYHAGMAEYMLGQRDLARHNLKAFLDLYHEADGWRANGLDVLHRLDDSTHAGADPRRPREPGQ